MMIFPLAAHWPSWSPGVFRCSRSSVHQHIAPTRVKAGDFAIGMRQPRLAIPPIFRMSRRSSGEPNTARWNAGTRGAPCPPAAMSRERKSPMTSMLVSSASSDWLPSCRNSPAVAGGVWSGHGSRLPEPTAGGDAGLLEQLLDQVCATAPTAHFLPGSAWSSSPAAEWCSSSSCSTRSAG